MAGSRAVQIQNSQRSGWRRSRVFAGHRDQGQRFVVYYRDGYNTERPLGYADTETERDALVAKIDRHPIFHSPRVRDRQVKG